MYLSLGHLKQKCGVTLESFLPPPHIPGFNPSPASVYLLLPNPLLPVPGPEQVPSFTADPSSDCPNAALARRLSCE